MYSAPPYSSYGPEYPYTRQDTRSNPYNRADGQQQQQPQSVQAPQSSDHYNTRSSQHSSDSQAIVVRNDQHPPPGYPPPDPFAAHYEAYYRHAYGGYPASSYPPYGYSASGYPMYGSYPVSGAGYPAGTAYPPAAMGYPPPSGSYPPSSYPPPGYPVPEGYPQALPEGYNSSYGVGRADPGLYGAMPGYPAHGYGMPLCIPPPPPGYASAPPGYPPQSAAYPPPPTSRRQSPKRDGRERGRDSGKRDWSDANSIPLAARGQTSNRGGRSGSARQGGLRSGPSGRFASDGRKPTSCAAVDGKSRLQQWLQIHPGWIAVWLEGIDPPRKLASTPNVTALMIVNSHIQRDGGEDFGFIFTSSRVGAKKKEREKECAKEIVAVLDALPLEDTKAWCQMPDANDAKREVEPGDSERLKTLVRRRCPKTTMDLPEPQALVLVAAMPWGPHERAHGLDPELTILERFDAGFAELLREARRVSGLVRKQWFVATVWVQAEQKEDMKPLALGVGLATDPNLAKVRAVHAAEVRAQVLSDAMFIKTLPKAGEKKEDRDKDDAKEKVPATDVLQMEDTGAHIR